MEDRRIVLCVFGAPRSGKTALIRAVYYAATNRLQYKYDPRASTPTVDAVSFDFLRTTVTVDGKAVDVKLEIWEMSLCIRSSFAVLQAHHRRCDAAIFVYAQDDAESFAYVKELLDSTLAGHSNRVAGALVCTKADIGGPPAVRGAEVLSLAGAHGLSQFTVSAKEGYNVPELINYIVGSIVRSDRARRALQPPAPVQLAVEPAPYRWLIDCETFLHAWVAHLRALACPRHERGDVPV